MASRFDIHIDIPENPTLPPRVSMYDDDEGERTPWQEVPVWFRGQDAKVIFAAAVLQSQRLQEMVGMAQQVAYVVWLGEENFDIHAITPGYCESLVAGVALEQATPHPVAPTRSRRM